jgi:DNA-directed RNA polymerase specialized sigma24 family protein
MPVMPSSEGSVLNGNRVVAIRARVRRGWSIKKIARTFGIARNTVRRYTRQGPAPCGPAKTSLDAEQELELVRQVARRWDTRDPGELESELTLKLAKIYWRKTIATNWKRLLIRALNLAAINWLRNRQRRERHVAAMDPQSLQQGELDASTADAATLLDIGFDDSAAIQHLRPALSTFLRRVLDALIADNFNQTQAAIRLGVHRNTIGNALRKICRIHLALKRRGN